MSAEQLKFEFEQDECKSTMFVDYEEHFTIHVRQTDDKEKTQDDAVILLDRGQAHLLMLYLREHLGYDEILKEASEKSGSYGK